MGRGPTDRLRLPHAGRWARWLERLAQSSGVHRVRRAVMRALPLPVLASDVENIVYLNWTVPVERVRPLVPDGVDLWARDGMTVLTVLTYRHGHFGLAALGPLRRLMPSPLQSNWRLYVQAVHGQPCEVPTVLFLPTMVDSLLYTVGTRIASDALPLHRPARFEHAWSQAPGGEDTLTTRIEPGTGSAPDLRIQLRRGAGLTTQASRGPGTEAEDSSESPSGTPSGPRDWRSLFTGRDAALAFLCLQDRSVVPVDDLPGVLAQGTIELPIPLGTIEPLDVVPGSFRSDWLQPWVGEAQPWCFRVPAVPFRVVGERLLGVGARSGRGPDAHDA